MQQMLFVLTPREAIDWLGEFPADSQFAAATVLAESWAVTEPEAAANWINGSFPGRTAGLSGVIKEWVYFDAESAASWVWTKFRGNERRDLMDAIAKEWIAIDGLALLAAWINDHGPDASLDGAISQLAIQTAEVDPATAMIWAQSIMDPDQRSMMEIVIGRQWIRMSPDDAARNLPDMLQSDSARAALLEPEPVEYYAPVPEEDYPVEAEPVEDSEGPLQ